MPWPPYLSCWGMIRWWRVLSSITQVFLHQQQPTFTAGSFTVWSTDGGEECFRRWNRANSCLLCSTTEEFSECALYCNNYLLNITGHHCNWWITACISYCRTAAGLSQKRRADFFLFQMQQVSINGSSSWCKIHWLADLHPHSTHTMCVNHLLSTA